MPHLPFYTLPISLLISVHSRVLHACMIHYMDASDVKSSFGAVSSITCSHPPLAGRLVRLIPSSPSLETTAIKAFFN